MYMFVLFFVYVFVFACVHTGWPSGPGPFSSLRTRNGTLLACFSAGMGPIWEVQRIELSMREPDVDPLSSILGEV